MENYILFLDEANVTGTNPYFCLGGIIIKRSIYEDELVKKINELKENYFSTTSVIFHYSDMKKNREAFSIFLDKTKRMNFWHDFNNTLRTIDFFTIGTYLNYKFFRESYKLKKNKHYEVAFIHLINNYITFLKNNNAMGNIIFESRQWKENADIQEVFHNILNNGTDMYKPEECQEYLSTIGFIIKKDNCVGLQVADFVPDSFMRNVNGAKNFYNVQNNFIDKMISIGGNYKDIVGLYRII